MGWNRDKWTSVILSAVIRVVALPIIGISYLIPPRRTVLRPCPLIDAIKRGDTEAVRSLLAQGADPNTWQAQISGRVGLYTRVVEVPESLAKTALILAVAGGIGRWWNCFWTAARTSMRAPVRETLRSFGRSAVRSHWKLQSSCLTVARI